MWRRRTRAFKIAALFVWSVLLITESWVTSAHRLYAQDGPPEYQVEGAYLFNFLKFVNWPDGASADAHEQWVIGIIGENPFGVNLARFAWGQTVKGHDPMIRQFHAGDDLRTCHILFISRSERARLGSILASLRGSPVLTVSDMDNFLAAGGMIQFLMEGDRVRFAVNPTAAERSRLKISSEVLALAQRVIGARIDGRNPNALLP
jgi:YfiR/HmsC-like